MKIGFWNVNKKSYSKDIVDFIARKDLDIVVLAECTVSGKTICKKLIESNSKLKYKDFMSTNNRLTVLSRFDSNYFFNESDNYGGNTWCVMRFELPRITSFNLVAVHLPSKIHWDETSQALEAANMMFFVRDYEELYHNRTIFIGDFNMNPYEAGMVSSIGLHGMKDLTIVANQSRVVQGQHYNYCYNPMWNFLGDKSELPGTYFMQKAIHNNVMWNTFDQVLIRHSLVKYLPTNCVELVTKIGSTKLIDQRTNRINTEYSDHLPIILTINL